MVRRLCLFYSFRPNYLIDSPKANLFFFDAPSKAPVGGIRNMKRTLKIIDELLSR